MKTTIPVHIVQQLVLQKDRDRTMSKSLKVRHKEVNPMVHCLLDICSKEDLVHSLVSLFIDQHNIKTKNTLILNHIHKASNKNTDKVKKEIGSNYDFERLQRIFECIVNESDKVKHGVVYTPRDIVRYIVKESINKNTKTVCDPACGTGVFLIESVKQLHKLTSKSISSIIENNIYGADILKEHIRYSELLLTLYMLYHKEDKKSLHFNLTSCNSLTFDWGKKYPKINGQFDAVISNPPYIRIQDITASEKRKLVSKWQTCIGAYNLYFTFFELGIKLLNKNGILGYITANSFFTSFAGKKLRLWLQDNRYVKKILDFTHLVLFDATSYTCVSFLDKKNNSYIDYGYITKYDDLNKLDNVDFSANLYDDIKPDKWRLLKTDERHVIEKIESTGNPLGQITEIKSGIATLKDKAYFVPYSTDKYIKKEYHGKTYFIENDITRNMIKIPDVDREINNVKPTHKIIFPYHKVNDKYKVYTESELKKKYPKCYKYLCAVKDILGMRDKGKKEYKTWYCYGRVQGFDVDDKKLLTPTFSNRPRFLYDKKGNTFFCNGYAIHNSTIPLDVIQKILNSKIMDYYITKTSVFVEGGYSCFQKNFIERFGIPVLTSKEIKQIKNTSNADTLDNMLLKKYGISQSLIH